MTFIDSLISVFTPVVLLIATLLKIDWTVLTISEQSKDRLSTYRPIYYAQETVTFLTAKRSRPPPINLKINHSPRHKNLSYPSIPVALIVQYTSERKQRAKLPRNERNKSKVSQETVNPKGLALPSYFSCTH